MSTIQEDLEQFKAEQPDWDSVSREELALRLRQRLWWVRTVDHAKTLLVSNEDWLCLPKT